MKVLASLDTLEHFTEHHLRAVVELVDDRAHVHMRRVMDRAALLSRGRFGAEISALFAAKRELVLLALTAEGRGHQNVHDGLLVGREHAATQRMSRRGFN